MHTFIGPNWSIPSLGAVLGISAIAVAVTGCNPQSPSVSPETRESDQPDVVATSTLIADWTARVGGDHIDLVGILAPGADPHVYEPVPQDTIALEEAELILYNGYNLEPNLIRLMTATGIRARTVAVGEIISPLTVSDETQTVPDPHVWGNVQNVVEIVELIRDELIQLVPEQQTHFTQNASVFIDELTRLDDWIQQQIATIPINQRQLVTTHDAFQYYAAAYGLTIAGTLIGISTEEQPSAQTVQRLAETIQQLAVPAIFAETTLNPQLIQTVAEEAGVTLASTELYSDSLAASGNRGDTYLQMMAVNTQTIVENLGGNVSPLRLEE